jgi:hypothetical protein
MAMRVADPRRPRALDPGGALGHIPGRAGGMAMEHTARLILAFVMTAVMVFMVTLIVTCVNLGVSHPHFLIQWCKAYFLSWPIAAITAFLFMPSARRITDRIVAHIGGPR